MSAYHASLALVLERQGRLEEALVSHREAVRLDSASARNRAGLGMLLLRLQRNEEAIPHLRSASESDRTSIDVRKALAAALQEQSRAPEALVVLREAKLIDSTDSGVGKALQKAQAGGAAEGYHDYSGFTDDHVVNRTVRMVLKWLFTVVLGICGLALVAPLIGGVILAAMSAFRPLTGGSPT